MWSQLGVLGSRVVEAVFVSDEAEKMEGIDVKSLIAKRMGIHVSEVDTRLISLYHKGELNGTASPSDRSFGNNTSKSPTLTKKDLDDFEKAEADAKNGTPARLGTPFKVFKPAVLNPKGTPKTPRTPPRTERVAPAAPTPGLSPAAEGDEVEQVHVAPAVTPGPASAAEGDEVEHVQPPVETKSDWSAEMEAEDEHSNSKGEGRGRECNAGVVTVDATEGIDADVWPESRKRYAEAVEAEHIYNAVGDITVPLLDQDDLGPNQLQYVVRDVVGQVNTAHKLLATAGYVVAERSKEALQQAKICGDMATEALLKAYEVAAVAASSSRQSWKMCITLTGPDMPARSKESEWRPDTAARYLAKSLFGVTLKEEEVAIAHFRGATSNEFIIKFTRTGFGSSHEDLLHASKALGRNRQLQVYAKIAPAEVDSEIYFLLRCMVKAGEAENSYTARSGRAAAWLPQEDGTATPYSFSTVMEVRAVMGPASRGEEAKRMAISQGNRRKRALAREAVGSGLSDAVREMGMTEDVIRDEARESGTVKNGGIRNIHKADVAIYRGIKMDSVPAWASYGRGRGAAGARGMRGGGHGPQDGQGRGSGTVAPLRARGRGGGRGGGLGRGGQGNSEGSGSVGAGAGRGRGRGSRGRGTNRKGKGGNQQLLSGSNLSTVDTVDTPTDRKRKLAEEDKAADETKKVKLMQMASPSFPASSSSSSTAAPPSAQSQSAQAAPSKSKGKNLLDILMRGEKLDVGKGFRLFD
jgi:hypothetical protein